MRWRSGARSLAFERAELEQDGDRRRRLLTFVVIGGEATGVELAGALARSCRATPWHTTFRTSVPDTARIGSLEGGPDVLPAFLPRRCARSRVAR